MLAGDSGAGIIDVLRFACGIAGMLYVVRRASVLLLRHISEWEAGASGRIVGRRASYHEAKYEQYMPVEPLPEVRVASETELGDVFPKVRTARYYYDYGDDWIHDIKLLRTYRSVHVADPQLWDGLGMRLRRMSAGCMGSSGSLIPWAILKMKNMMAWLSGPRTRCGIVSR